MTTVLFPDQHWCRHYGTPCTNANTWNECKLTACNRTITYPHVPVVEIKREENKMTNIEEHDGCKDCAFEGRMYYQSPCSDCKQNYTDKWRAKPIKKEFTEEYLIKVFEDKFQGRRAISLDEIREVTKEIFK